MTTYTIPTDEKGADLPYMETVSGRRYCFDQPCASQIHPIDIAHALMRYPRWGGHTVEPWSVADHSRLVQIIALEIDAHTHAAPDPWLGARALLHDAHEAYIGDIVSPLARAIGEHRIAELKGKADAVISEALGVPVDARIATLEIVRRADAGALYVESVCLRPGPWRPRRNARALDQCRALIAQALDLRCDTAEAFAVEIEAEIAAAHLATP